MKRTTRGLMMAGVGLVGLGILMTGCSWSIGSGREHRTPHATTVQPTRGQELIDLKKARDEGAISEKEYEAAKKRIVNQ